MLPLIIQTVKKEKGKRGSKQKRVPFPLSLSLYLFCLSLSLFRDVVRDAPLADGGVDVGVTARAAAGEADENCKGFRAENRAMHRCFFFPREEGLALRGRRRGASQLVLSVRFRCC